MGIQTMQICMRRINLKKILYTSMAGEINRDHSRKTGSWPLPIINTNYKNKASKLKN